MEVRYRLTGILAVVGEYPVAALVDSLLGGNPRRKEQRVGGDDTLCRSQLTQCGEMPAGDHQNVDRRLWMEVTEGNAMFAFADELGSKFAQRDAAENAVRDLGFAHARAAPLVHAKPVVGCGPGRSRPAALDVDSSMPELPEVETVRRSLLESVVGQTIEGLRLRDFPGVLGEQRIEDVSSRVVGRRVHAIHRRAKYLIFELDDGTALVVHLRMTGVLTVTRRDAEPLRFEHLAIELGNGLDLRFSDQRKFGRVLHVSPEEVQRLEGRLGQEPLTRNFTAAWLADRLRRRPGRIKAVILDQGLIGGLGNIYADESLFRAGIHPERAANSLSTEEIQRLHRAIRAVLRAAIDNQGTTFSSFADAEGNPGRYGAVLSVYGRGGKGVCPRCGTPLERTIVGGRGTSYCPKCQPLRG